MNRPYNVSGPERKRLVTALGDVLGTKPTYLGMPSMAYEIGAFTVDKDGTLTGPDGAELEHVALALADQGCQAKGASKPTEASEPGDSEAFHLNVAVPRSSLDEQGLANLQALLDSKGELIQHALGIAELPIEYADEAIVFPWFKDLLRSEDVEAYSHFIVALCQMAREQTHVTAKERPVENEKYAFRCFLLRLGFIGDAYKQDRKILLRHLSGSSAFKTVKSEGLDDG